MSKRFEKTKEMVEKVFILHQGTLENWEETSERNMFFNGYIMGLPIKIIIMQHTVSVHITRELGGTDVNYPIDECVVDGLRSHLKAVFIKAYQNALYLEERERRIDVYKQRGYSVDELIDRCVEIDLRDDNYDISDDLPRNRFFRKHKY